MFDQSTYSKEFIDSANAWKKAQNKWIDAQAQGKSNKEVQKLGKEVNKRFEEYKVHHNKWCDEYGFKGMKY